MEADHVDVQDVRCTELVRPVLTVHLVTLVMRDSVSSSNFNISLQGYLILI